jgi:hypothetical protein
MPIGNVVERGNLVYVYDENGHQLCSIISGHGLMMGSSAIRRLP